MPTQEFSNCTHKNYLFLSGEQKALHFIESYCNAPSASPLKAHRLAPTSQQFWRNTMRITSCTPLAVAFLLGGAAVVQAQTPDTPPAAQTPAAAPAAAAPAPPSPDPGPL